jgi:hypothetical protein
VVRRLLRAPLTWLLLAVLAVAGSFGMYWFQPWKLFTNTTVNETLSAPQPSGAVSDAPSVAPSVTPSVTPSVATVPVVVRQGTFITHEHDTAGTARIVRTPTGELRLELVGLSTSNGPDLRVWLTDQEVRTGVAGWRVFDDGKHVELGKLKGNRGDQVYAIGADVDLDAYRSVSIWCARFAVSFGAAELR